MFIDSASAYVGGGNLLVERRKNLFWFSYAAHCIDSMLSDIGYLSAFYDTINKAKEVAVFIYRHQWVLDLFRKYTKKRDLTRVLPIKPRDRQFIILNKLFIALGLKFHVHFI